MLAKLLYKSSSASSDQKAPLSRLSGLGPPREAWCADYIDLTLHDHTTEYLVAIFSWYKPTLYQPHHLPTSKQPSQILQHPTKSRPLQILVLDVRMKYNQNQCFLLGDLKLAEFPILRGCRNEGFPLFSICLSHQLLALAVGSKKLWKENPSM
ncbi:carbamoyl-phosphate synthase small subunit [Puccinia sorghi]|uniref:Carbamoyl-phosphate synthase small subunit n=1 Tax=Puccinia sorghi TaxID=27349 RepID=A0A0L6VDW7_9BASI|nr:carbamoyl-phosphate synthase small subunit [Puccinia sorghi]